MLWDVFGAHVVLHGHDVEMGVDAMGGGGVQAVQIKSLKKKMVGAMEVWWSVPEPFQGPCCGTCSNHFPTAIFACQIRNGRT